MNITAEQIQGSVSRSRIIGSEIKTLLRTIQSEILQSSKNGSTGVSVAIPTNFSIVGMSNQTAQTIIYHGLIEELEDRGFTVKIEMKNSSVKYHIYWHIDDNNTGLKTMRDVIASKIVKSEK